MKPSPNWLLLLKNSAAVLSIALSGVRVEARETIPMGCDQTISGALHPLAGGIAMQRIKHWQDSINAVVGVWLLASAWILGLIPTIGSAGVGVLLFGTSIGTLFVPRAWEEWIELALGAWLMTSPWLLGFADLPSARTNAVLVGITVTALALWVMWTEDDFHHWRHRKATR
jgi:SPW repeat